MTLKQSASHLRRDCVASHLRRDYYVQAQLLAIPAANGNEPELFFASTKAIAIALPAATCGARAFCHATRGTRAPRVLGR